MRSISVDNNYKGPLFVDGIDTLSYLYRTVCHKGNIKRMSQKVEGFHEIILLPDTDWFFGAEFIFPDGTDIIMAFPWCPDCYNFVGEETEIRIALYVKGENNDYCKIIMHEMTNILWTEFCSKPITGKAIPSEIFFIIDKDGRKLIPKWYVSIRAYLHPVNGGDPFLSWLEAERWFVNCGFIFYRSGNGYFYPIPPFFLKFMKMC